MNGTPAAPGRRVIVGTRRERGLALGSLPEVWALPAYGLVAVFMPPPKRK